MKFQWYIINTVEATIEGCNDVDKIRKYVDNDEYLVLTAQHGVFFHGDDEQHNVLELDTSQDDEDDNDEEDDDEESDEDLINSLEDDGDDEDSDPSTGAPLNFEHGEVGGKPHLDDGDWPA